LKLTASNQTNRGFELFLIPCKNYTHAAKYLLPIKPSPNLPNMQSVYLYPSLCFFEGTKVSVGRGTDKPFQEFGSPNFPTNLYEFTPQSTEGAKNPPFLNQPCYGFDLSVTPIGKEVRGQLVLTWLIQAYRLCPDKKNFFLPSNYFNRLAGNIELMQQIKDGKTEDEIRESWLPTLRLFKSIRKKYLIYPDFQ
jgi:uncharacterized protein YbbC (DUF1343 family)